MTFTVADFDDFVRLLEEHPEWRSRLRPIILGEEFLRLPEQIGAFGSRLDRIEAILERLAARQEASEARFDRIEARLDRIETILDRMAARQDEFDQRLAAVAAEIARLTEQVANLVEAVGEHNRRLNRHDGRMGNIEGQLLELRYRDHLRNWLGAYVLRAEPVTVEDLVELQNGLATGALSMAEVSRLRDVDLLVRGSKRENEHEQVVIAMEISQTINLEDIERANEHALTLRRAGYNALGMVGGNRLADGLEERASELGVTVDLRRPAA